MSEDLTRIHRIPGETAYRVGRNAFQSAAGRADALYMAGGRLRVLDVLEELEADIKAPVIGSTQAVVWEMCNHFGTTAPIDGYGMLLREFPPNGM